MGVTWGSEKGIGGLGGAETVSSSSCPGLLQVEVLSEICSSSHPPVCPTTGCDWTGDRGAGLCCLSAANRTSSWQTKTTKKVFWDRRRWEKKIFISCLCLSCWSSCQCPRLALATLAFHSAELTSRNCGCLNHRHIYSTLTPHWAGWPAAAIGRHRCHIGGGSSAPWTDTSQWSELYKVPSTKCYMLMSHLHIHIRTDIFRKQRWTKNNVCNVLWWL